MRFEVSNNNRIAFTKCLDGTRLNKLCLFYQSRDCTAGAKQVDTICGTQSTQ